MIPTPLTPHLSQPEYESVYEPAEDTFVLLDALEQDAHLLQGSTLCLEVGSGSGCVIAFLAAICGTHRALYLTTDLNPTACRSTLLTAQTNSQSRIEAINTDLTASLSDRLSNQVDVLMFNPPYVETEEEEATTAQRDPHMKGIEKTWAGGARGMTVTNRLLSQVKSLLSPRGLFYLVAVPENKPQQILADMLARGLHVRPEELEDQTVLASGTTDNTCPASSGTHADLNSFDPARSLIITERRVEQS